MNENQQFGQHLPPEYKQQVVVGSNLSNRAAYGKTADWARNLLRLITSSWQYKIAAIAILCVAVGGTIAVAFVAFHTPDPAQIVTEAGGGSALDTNGDGKPDAKVPGTDPEEPGSEANDAEEDGQGDEKPGAGGGSGGNSSGSNGGTSGGGSNGGDGSSSGSNGGGSSGSSNCDLPKYPTAACTGVPAGWSPTTTINGDLSVTTPGAVIENHLVTGTIYVQASNVTIRNTRVYGSIDNFIGNVIYGHMLIEDSEVVLPPGQSVSNNLSHAIGVSNFTCRRCKITDRAEGWRVGANVYSGAGAVTIEHSYARLKVTQAQCDALDPHGDGIQGYGGNFATVRHNTIDQRADPCPTAPIFISDSSDGGNFTDNVLAGGGYSLRLLSGNYPNVTGNKIVHGTWDYGPVDVVCGSIGNWSGNATVTFNFGTGTILSQVGALNNC